jgi:hypothetical protein
MVQKANAINKKSKSAHADHRVLYALCCSALLCAQRQVALQYSTVKRKKPMPLIKSKSAHADHRVCAFLYCTVQ